MKKQKQLVIPVGAVILTKEECESIRVGIKINESDTQTNINENR